MVVFMPYLFSIPRCSSFNERHFFFVDFMLFDWLMISSSDLLISWYEILDSRCERIQLDALKIAQTTLFISTNRLRIYLCAWKFTSVDKIIHQHRFQLNAIRSLAHAVRVNSWIRQIHEHSSVFFLYRHNFEPNKRKEILKIYGFVYTSARIQFKDFVELLKLSS